MIFFSPSRLTCVGKKKAAVLRSNLFPTLALGLFYMYQLEIWGVNSAGPSVQVKNPNKATFK